MRILYLCPDTGIDVLGGKGAAIHVREMIAAFARAGHDVELVAPRLTKPGAPPAADVRATVRRVRVPDEVQTAKQGLDHWCDQFDPGTSLPKDVRRILYDAHLVTWLHDTYDADPPDLIYVRASLLSTAGVALARRTGRPLVVELNAPLAQEQPTSRGGALDHQYAAAERELLGAADSVVVVSEALVDHVVGLGVDPDRVEVLVNGIDPDRFHPAPAGRAPSPRPVLGFVGGLRPWHGVERLPEVLALVQRRHPGARLVIAGDGPLRAEIELAAERAGVADAVTLLGAVDHATMPDTVRGFDIALAPYPDLPHDFYFSPLKLYEYLGCGVPVVASAVGQIDRVLTDGVDARLVRPGDVAALAAACVDLLDDPATAARLGAAGAALVHDRFTWDRNAAAVAAHARTPA